MELNTTHHRVYCCESKAYAVNDNAKGEVFLIRRLLRQVQDLEDDTVVRTRGRSHNVSSRKRWAVVGMASTFPIQLKYFRPEMSARYVQVRTTRLV